MSQRIPTGPERQQQIYQAGAMGRKPTIPLSYSDLEALAKSKLPQEAYDYVAGGAGSENTMATNLAAFDRWRIVPRMMRNVERRDMAVELGGRIMPAPILLAPVGVLGIVHPDAELAVARACKALGLTMILSTLSSFTLENVAEVGAHRWFQLYWSNDQDIAASMVARAEAAGFEALVVTLDTPIIGWRERDLQNAYLPFLQGKGLANYFTDPAFLKPLSKSPEEELLPAVMRFAQVFGNTALTWSDLAFLRGRTKLPIWVKGIQAEEDARLAIDHGANGIIVSNHGGRQVDGAIGSLTALPPIVEAVKDRVPILFDSGIRRGADIFKAVALGANAVLVGRPYTWGLAVGGETGVREVLLNLICDLDLTMGLSGCATLRDVKADRLHAV